MSRTELWHRVFDRPSPLLKQIPTLLALLIGYGLTVMVPEMKVTGPVSMNVGAGLILVASVYAAVLSSRRRYEGFIVMLVPMIDIIGLGLFRTGTGGVHSLFGSLILIPVVWLATAPGLRYVVFVLFLSSFNYLTQFIAEPPGTSVEWIRGVISPLVFAVVAAVINELSRQQRKKIEEAEQLVEDRTRALDLNERMIERLKQTKKEYQALLESFESLWSSITAQAIFATDTRGKVQAWTPGAERLFGLTVQEALDLVTIDRFFPSASVETFAETHAFHSEAHARPGLPEGIRALFAAADETSALETELEVVAASGAIVPARVTITQRRDADGHRLGYLFVVTDESRAAEVARMKDEFVGMVSHELRTPLSSILGFLDLLQNDPEQPLSEDQQDFVTIIERNANRLLALVGDLLFTAQVESGSFPLVLSAFDLSESVAASAQSARPNAQRGDVALSLELPDEPLVITADPMRVGQALDNLLSNAIKFTPPGGRVVVGARELDDCVELWVRDTGMGIPKDEQEQLFTRFFRASTATRNAVPGIGLGLAIIRAIVLAHGGSVSLTSDEGEGTAFRVSLPLVPVEQ